MARRAPGIPPGWTPWVLLGWMEGDRRTVKQIVADRMPEAKWGTIETRVRNERNRNPDFQKAWAAQLAKRGQSATPILPRQKLEPKEVYAAAKASRGLKTRAAGILNVDHRTLQARLDRNNPRYDEQAAAAWNLGVLEDAEGMVEEVRKIAEKSMAKEDFKTALLALTRALEANPKTPDWHRRSRVDMRVTGEVKHRHELPAAAVSRLERARELLALPEPVVDAEFEEVVS